MDKREEWRVTLCERKRKRGRVRENENGWMSGSNVLYCIV